MQKSARYFSCPSYQTIKTPPVKAHIARDPAAIQGFRAPSRSIAPASPEFARLSRGQFSLVVDQGGVVKLLIAVAGESIISDELELRVRATPGRDIMGFVEFPAQHVVRWRNCVLAIRARSRLLAVGASSDYDVRNGADE